MNFNNVTPNEEVEIKHRKKHPKLNQGKLSLLTSEYYHHYKIWNNIMGRCYNPELPYYKYYGARGIRVCEEWKDFKVFLNWLIDHGYEPNKGMSIERVDEDKGYNPDNCILVDKVINCTFKGNTNHFIINEHYLVSVSTLAENYPEYEDDILEYHSIGCDYLIPEMLKELGLEDTIKYITKQDYYKKLELL